MLKLITFNNGITIVFAWETIENGIVTMCSIDEWIPRKWMALHENIERIYYLERQWD